MQNDADITAAHLADYGVMPTKEHLDAIESKFVRDEIAKTARETESCLFLRLRMKDLTVYIIQTPKEWNVRIHSSTFNHVDMAIFALDVKLETVISYLEMREDW